MRPRWKTGRGLFNGARHGKAFKAPEKAEAKTGLLMFIIDNAEEIRRRLEEIEAEHKLALTGSSVPEDKEVPSVETVYGIKLGISQYFEGLPPPEHQWSVDPIPGKQTKSAHEWTAEFEKQAALGRVKASG